MIEQQFVSAWERAVQELDKPQESKLKRSNQENRVRKLSYSKGVIVRKLRGIDSWYVWTKSGQFLFRGTTDETETCLRGL